jgi:c-di-GMP-binding flagellar brake protein YcgR
MVERRKHKRFICHLKTVIDRTLPDGKRRHLEFRSESLSGGGVFILSEDLSLFDLGEDVAVVVEDDEDRYYEGKARVVRSARYFTEDKKIDRSGFGLMFIDPPPEYLTKIDKRVGNNDTVIL